MALLRRRYNMDWETLHDIALVDMAEKIGCDQVLDDLIQLLPEDKLEEYLRIIDRDECLGIFNKIDRKNGRTKRNLCKS